MHVRGSEDGNGVSELRRTRVRYVSTVRTAHMQGGRAASQIITVSRLRIYSVL